MTAILARSELAREDGADLERQHRMTQKLTDDVQKWTSGRRRQGQSAVGPNRVQVVVLKRTRRPADG